MRRILIVDDEALIREILAEVLADEGYGVQTAADGAEALRAIAAMVPDLVISDVMMPVLSGWQLLDRVHETNPTLPVILISAVDPRIAGRKEILTTDHTAFLAKPFALEELLGLIQCFTNSATP